MSQLPDDEQNESPHSPRIAVDATQAGIRIRGFAPTITTVLEKAAKGDPKSRNTLTLVVVLLAATVKVYTKASAPRAAIPTVHVPQRSERILTLLAPPNRQEEVLGDFEEGMRLVADRHGEGWARRWYRWHVARYAFGRLIALVGQVADAVGKLWKLT